MSTAPLRVLQVVQRFYPELGGLETHVAEVTSRLRDVPDIDITILTTDRSGELPQEDLINGVRVIRRRSWPRNRDYYFAPGLARVIRTGGWDVVHLQGGQTFVPLIGMLAALSARIPYVLTFHTGGHSTAARSALGDLRTKLLRPLLSRAAGLIAVSRFEKKRFVAETGIDADRFQVINNGGALPAVPAGVRPVAGTIVSSGRLEKYKGHHRVIQALPEIRTTVPGARLTILGGGPYETELRSLADSLGVGTAVTIEHIPPAERSRMAEILAGSSVMAALSSFEAHPVGIMEALAIGLPVLGCDVAGIGDLVEDGLVTGIGVDAPADEVAAALVRMLETPPAEPRTPADFHLPTWEECTADLAQVYRRVAGDRESVQRASRHRASRHRASRHRASGSTGSATGSAAVRPLRVAQIITTLTTGGAERQLQSLVAHSSNTHRTIALYEGGTVAEAMRRSGAAVDVLGMGGLRKAVAIARLAQRLRRMRPDVVHVHLLSAQLWGIPAARLARVPVVLSTEHSLMDTSLENRPLTPVLHGIYRTLESMVTRTVAVSTTTKARLVRWGVDPERISVIDNGIDFAELAFSAPARDRVRTEFGIADGTELIGAVGRLEPVKRFPELLEALAPTLAPGVRELLVVGAGPLLQPLADRAAALGVADCVHLPGPRGDVPALLSAMDVLVSPSRDETFGMAVLEGLGAGLPVVYAQCPALDELPSRPDWAVELPAPDRTGGTDPGELREAVDQALHGRLPGARHPLPQAVTDAYGIERTAGALDTLYAELVAGRTGTGGPHPLSPEVRPATGADHARPLETVIS